MEPFPDQLPTSFPFSTFNLQQPPFPPSSLPLLEYYPSSSSSQSPLPTFTPPHLKPIKVPKQEPLESTDPWLPHLPDLHSIEDQPNRFPSTASTKRFRPPSFTTTDSYNYTNLDALVNANPHLLFPYSSSPSLSPSLSVTADPSPDPRPPTRPSPNESARKRRKTISEKTRTLAKLMPWEKKMDMATMLSEAYKYIRFLQAQVSVLQSMPYLSLFPPIPPNTNGVSSGFGGLEKLNRQQLLQVVVNSPVAQTMLSSQESCVYSLEQLLMLKNGFYDFFPKANAAHHP